VYIKVVYEIKGKRILVAGASGFLGTWLTRKLLEVGAAVTGASLSGAQANFPELPMISADLRSFHEAEEVMEGIEALVIASAVTSGAQVMESNPLAHLFDNNLMNNALLRAAVQRHVERVIFISSSTVYPVGSWAMSEDDVNGSFFHKYEVVASMKLATEGACRLVSEHSETEAIVVRPGNAYGPYDHFDSATSHVIPALVSKIARASENVEVWGDGEDIKNFIYAEDLADGIVSALANGMPGEVYNLGGTSEVRIREVVDALLSIADKSHVPAKYDPSKPSMIPERRIDSSKARLELGFRPSMSLEDGLKRTYEWYVGNKL